MTDGHIVVLCTCPDAATAERIAQTLVEEELAACVNVVPGLISLYRWQGAVQRDSECLLLIKTRAAPFEILAHRIRSLHPYTVPEIIALPIAQGSAAYLQWIDESTRPA
ncbi:MAG TPA: divalent-cation tolerance protein CutA [Gammaproteobacteria bacterium]|nr:divalent-cation tolerance protein CutA [Gammaproteobacteria bacterium]